PPAGARRRAAALCRSAGTRRVRRPAVGARRQQLAGGQGPAARSRPEAPEGRPVLVQGRPGRSGEVQGELSKEFWGATAANEGKYELDQKTCGIKDKATGKIPDFIVGLPFPKIDKSDPQVACKIAQNFAFAGSQGGGGGATFTLNGVDTSG